jgi:hypothetical protein
MEQFFKWAVILLAAFAAWKLLSKSKHSKRRAPKHAPANGLVWAPGWMTSNLDDESQAGLL